METKDKEKDKEKIKKDKEFSELVTFNCSPEQLIMLDAITKAKYRNVSRSHTLRFMIEDIYQIMTKGDISNSNNSKEPDNIDFLKAVSE